MRIVIAGASGFIGSYLIKHFNEKGHTVVALSRNPERYKNSSKKGVFWKKWQDGDYSDWIDELADADAVINLVGESIAGKRWTKKQKKAMLESRVKPGELITKAIERADKKPTLLFQVSAIGIYKSSPGRYLDENAAIGDTFLSNICQKWEKSTSPVDKLTTKRYILRIGLVLGDESFLMKMLKLQFNLFTGGYIGNGRQGFSWIHIQDVVKAIDFLMTKQPEPGVHNLTAPNPVTMKEFCKALGRAMHRPFWLPVPGFAIKLVFGKEMAEETILSGDLVVPQKLKDHGFEFDYSDTDSALKSFF